MHLHGIFKDVYSRIGKRQKEELLETTLARLEKAATYYKEGCIDSKAEYFESTFFKPMWRALQAPLEEDIDMVDLQVNHMNYQTFKTSVPPPRRQVPKEFFDQRVIEATSKMHNGIRQVEESARLD